MDVSAQSGCVVCGRPLLRNRVTCSTRCQSVRNGQIQREKSLARLTDAQRTALPALYAAGLSYLKIGRELHLSEHQAERLSRRLGLPLRGSPVQIKRRREAEAQQNAPVSSSADVSGAQPELCADVSSSLDRAPEPQPPQVILGARLFQGPVMPATPFPPFRSCQWIEGDGRPWSMCGASIHAHSAYCRAHYRRAYTRRAEIIQEAA